MKKSIESFIAEYTPPDTGWAIRMGYMDVTQGLSPQNVINYFNTREKTNNDLSDDEKAARTAFSVWNSDGPIDVGESGTLFRLVQFYFWKMGINRKIITHGTLTKRVEEMDATSDIIHLPLAERGKFEGGTSQWISASILMNNREILPEVSFYVQKSYDARDYRINQEKLGLPIDYNRPDPTIKTQIEEYIKVLKFRFDYAQPDRLGDCDLYCFLRAFDRITADIGRSIWPQVQKHESNRIEKMESSLLQLHRGEIITSNDHRVVEAIAMLIQSLNPKISIAELRSKFLNPDCVAKKWPRFWEFMEKIRALL